jgi:hypothetical protein
MKNYFEQLKQTWLDWQATFKHLGDSVTGLQNAVTKLESTLPAVEKFTDDLTINKPHLERIAEAQERIELEMSKYRRK